MRFLKVTTFYDDYLRQFYRRRPLLRFASYAQQKQALYFDCFGWADFFQVALTPLGYQAEELLINAKPLQRAWVSDNGGAFPRANWPLEIALRQVVHFKPEILFLDDMPTFPGEWIARVRQSCPSLRLVIGWCGAPTVRAEALPAYDLLLSCVPELVAELRGMGARSHHLHHAFEPRVLGRIDAHRPPAHDLSFVGQVVPGSAFHEERQRILVRLAELFDIRIFSPSGYRSPRARVKDAARPLVDVAAGLLDWLKLPEGVRSAIPLPRGGSGPRVSHQLPQSIARHIAPPVFGLEMFQTLHDSRTTFNCHIGASRRSASNMRLFEATGAGSCLVTDYKDDLAGLFEIDQEVVAYRSLDECIEKIRWLLDHPLRAREIARRGQERTLRDHTFAHRAESLHEIMRGAMA